MRGGKSFLAVIPARGGSKGIPNKNIKDFCGKPLIQWCIESAKDSGVFDRIVVNSDSGKILAVAAKCGVDGQLRPAELATDAALVMDVMVNSLLRLGEKYDYVQLIQATSPGIRPAQICSAADMILGLPPFEQWKDKNADMVIGVHRYKDPTIVVKEVPDDLCLRGWYPNQFKDKNRQDLPPAYRINGYIYLAKWDVWVNCKDYWKTNIYAYFCDEYDDIDIDSKWDWSVAEARFRAAGKHRASKWNVCKRMVKRLLSP
ncbi:hypothetical protein A2197_01245 [Candidatus Woesebacteria bacterium RIFOXYA1_FULL_48_16]|uniref:Acylneuraminate cytidylyltransferase n=1 Tax=Candidatus Woesebacteria bacterium RIFOXYA1_FULL_48_16 TaxID=1802535 RepID=A0A1F8CTD4_9BACT|nr:MAG: hypothetical protein A2197_01245 [Candidatus Woesebacteria bacterium RIFOXYA1_FULL_48_16]